MIAVDTNLLVYSHRGESPFHRRAKELIESLRYGPALWAIPLHCVHEFIGIVTHPRIYSPATTLPDAFTAIGLWGAGDNLRLLDENESYVATLRTIATAAGIKGAQIHDARVAAVCLHHGVQELWTADRDFSLFPQLKTRNPLAQSPD